MYSETSIGYSGVTPDSEHPLHQRQASGRSNLVHTGYCSSLTPAASLEGQAIAAQTPAGWKCPLLQQRVLTVYTMSQLMVGKNAGAVWSLPQPLIWGYCQKLDPLRTTLSFSTYNEKGLCFLLHFTANSQLLPAQNASWFSWVSWFPEKCLELPYFTLQREFSKYTAGKKSMYDVYHADTNYHA